MAYVPPSDPFNEASYNSTGIYPSEQAPTGFEVPPSQISTLGSIVYGPSQTTVKVSQIYNTKGMTTVSTVGPHGLGPGDSFSILGSDNPNFNGSFVVGQVLNAASFSFPQSPPLPASSGGPGPVVPDGSLNSGELGVGNPPPTPGVAAQYGQYGFITIPYSVIQASFKKAFVPGGTGFSTYDGPRSFPPPPSVAWAVNPGTFLKFVFLGKRMQADVAVDLAQNQLYRFPVRYLGACDVDQQGRYSIYVLPNRFYVSPVDPSISVKLMRGWVPLF